MEWPGRKININEKIKRIVILSRKLQNIEEPCLFFRIVPVLLSTFTLFLYFVNSYCKILRCIFFFVPGGLESNW